ncbi:MAG: SAM-dependent methyltransferase [Hydrogenophilales bacterium]|nr:SAM-dependent methyltransferase [Hydrogenophilales bacterium]
MSTLPTPAPEALDHSGQLRRHIEQAIEAAGGWLSFATYMELTLYAPGLGYYAAGAGKFGASGDFVTAPEISSHFGRTLARQAEQVLSRTGGDILELGAGSGRLALDILGRLAEMNGLPGRYLILEVSPDLRQRQRDLFAAERPELLDRMVWLDRLPDRFNGLVLANEVLDALPVHLVRWGRAGIEERGVGLAGSELIWIDRAISTPLLKQGTLALPAQAPGYVSEINLAGPALIQTLADRLGQGLMLFLDYGFPRAEYYHPQRDGGTLMCHYRHHAHTDPFFLPGLQDITAHVDFTAIADAAQDAGMAVMGYSNQATFLINCGLLDGLGGLDPRSREYLQAMSGIQKLLQPTEMGELFKVLAIGKNVPGPLLGFSRGDRLHSL